MASKKKGLTLNKIKRCFIEVFKEIGNLFKSLFNKFMTIPNNIKIIGGVWIVIFIIILVLIIGTSNNNKLISKYQGFEEIINTKALEYAERNELYATRDSKLPIDLEQLKESGYITTEDVDDNSCRAYSLVYYDDANEEYKSETYINCLKYKSKDYDAYK